ncbi:ly6/PLAUR domain-containing protein 8 [Thomomys bottae]
MSSSTMRGILVAGVIMALAVATIESLDCTGCNSAEDDCASATVIACSAESESCVHSLTSSFLGNTTTVNEIKSCSPSNCTGQNDTLMAFTVRVSEEEYFSFADQCCQGKDCDDISNTTASPDASRNTECPACYGYNVTSCTEKTQTCNHDEQCVSLTADIGNGTEPTLFVKGCSNISNSTCQFLATENQTVGHVLFIKVECKEATIILTPTTKPNTSSSCLGISSSFLSFTSFLLVLLLL